MGAGDIEDGILRMGCVGDRLRLSTSQCHQHHDVITTTVALKIVPGDSQLLP